MFRKVINATGFHSLIILYAFFIVFSSGCGGFIRDSEDSSLQSRDAYSDTESADTYYATDAIEELKTDTLSNTLTDVEDVYDVIVYPDAGTDEYLDTTEDLIIDVNALPDYYIDAIDRDIDHNEDTPAGDTAIDISYSDISFSGDTSSTCDCDTNWCGVCYYPGTEGLKDQALKGRLYDLIKDHKSLGYDSARQKMFSEIDNKDGWVECVYTGFRLQTDGIPNSNVMNTEHTWPQSEGAGSEPARSDLFHLFPTKSDANSKRGSYPFGTVVNITWSEGGSKLGTDSTGDTVFEPRDIHKGNVARAMFYFSIRYRLPIDNKQEAELRKWHTLDPVDENEIERCNKINSYQNNRNPFVDWPDFVNRIKDF
jgi:endonuclease I